MDYVSPAKGYGLFTTKPIPANTFVCEYVGERVPPGTSRSDYSLLVCEQGKSLFAIDSSRKGNVSRFVNHSCPVHATLRLELVRVNHLQPRVALVAQRDVLPDEELTFTYGSILALECEACSN